MSAKNFFIKEDFIKEYLNIIQNTESIINMIEKSESSSLNNKNFKKIITNQEDLINKVSYEHMNQLLNLKEKKEEIRNNHFKALKDGIGGALYSKIEKLKIESKAGKKDYSRFKDLSKILKKQSYEQIKEVFGYSEKQIIGRKLMGKTKNLNEILEFKNLLEKYGINYDVDKKDALFDKEYLKKGIKSKEEKDKKYLKELETTRKKFNDSDIEFYNDIFDKEKDISLSNIENIDKILKNELTKINLDQYKDLSNRIAILDTTTNNLSRMRRYFERSQKIKLGKISVGSDKDVHEMHSVDKEYFKKLLERKNQIQAEYDEKSRFNINKNKNLSKKENSIKNNLSKKALNRAVYGAFHVNQEDLIKDLKDEFKKKNTYENSFKLKNSEAKEVDLSKASELKIPNLTKSFNEDYKFKDNYINSFKAFQQNQMRMLSSGYDSIMKKIDNKGYSIIDYINGNNENMVKSIASIPEDKMQVITNMEKKFYRDIKNSYKDDIEEIVWNGDISKINIGEDEIILKEVNNLTSSQEIDGSKIKNYSLIEFPDKVSVNNSFSLVFPVKDKEGREIEDLNFSAHYDNKGNLIELTHPVGQLMYGKSSKDPVCIKKNNEIYALPINQDTYKNMLNKIKESRGNALFMSKENKPNLNLKQDKNHEINNRSEHKLQR